MEYERKFPPQKMKRTTSKEEGCKIILKKKKDGTVVKEIRGKCTRDQIEALSRSDMGGTEDEA